MCAVVIGLRALSEQGRSAVSLKAPFCWSDRTMTPAVHEIKSQPVRSHTQRIRRRWSPIFFMAVVFIATAELVSEGLLICLTPIRVRPVDSADEGLRYHGFVRHDQLETRPILEITGTFSRDRTISAKVCVVEAGKVRVGTIISASRTRNRAPDPIWQSMRVFRRIGRGARRRRSVDAARRGRSK